jgi:chorismate dehydratase
LDALPTFAAKFKLIALDRKIRVGAVSYLNTKPLLYGIENSPVFQEITLSKEYPALIADQLLNDEIDIGLVPVAIIPGMKEYHIYTRFCIGCDGPVSSVCLFSESPIEQVKTVLLDYQSRTSVLLAEILFEKLWKHKPLFEPAGPDFLSRINGNTAAVVIGDQALRLRMTAAYIYDLGEAWKQLTGLPFVFAAWISNKVLDPGWVARFEQANAIGVEHISLVLEQLPENEFDLKKYYTHYLNYIFDTEKKKGLNLFLKMLEEKNTGIVKSQTDGKKLA